MTWGALGEQGVAAASQGIRKRSLHPEHAPAGGDPDRALTKQGGTGMEMDPTILALRRFEDAERAYTAFTGNLLESGATITEDLRARAKALREALDTARGSYHEALQDSGRMVPFTH